MANSFYQGEALATQRKSRPAKLPTELKERFIAYFMRRYPCTNKIKVGKNGERAYTVRVNYKDERNRTIFITAYTYETLVIRMKEAYAMRGLQAVI